MQFLSKIVKVDSGLEDMCSYMKIYVYVYTYVSFTHIASLAWQTKKEGAFNGSSYNKLLLIFSLQHRVLLHSLEEKENTENTRKAEYEDRGTSLFHMEDL